MPDESDRSDGSYRGAASDPSSIYNNDLRLPQSRNVQNDSTANSSVTQSNLSPPIASIESANTNNSFSQLVRGWENFLSTNDSNIVPPFYQPLQMPQDLMLCEPTTSQGLVLFTQGAHDGLSGTCHPLQPPALRHTHSSPNQYGPPMMDIDGRRHVEALPPPVPLDPYQRSTSTPSAFRGHSLHSNSFGVTKNSAFTLRSQRISYTGDSFNGQRALHSAFDPVKYYTRALEDMEKTSIEVMDITRRNEKESSDENDDQIDAISPEIEPSTSLFQEKSDAPVKRGAAFRAARFLTDVRVLRTKRRMRTSRENPTEPHSSTKLESQNTKELYDDNQTGAPLFLETAVTVVTETHAANLPISRNTAMESATSIRADDSSKIQHQIFTGCVECQMNDVEDGKVDEQPTAGQYEQLDSDVDEEDNLYRCIDAQLHVDSPGTPSPSYERFVDDRPTSNFGPSGGHGYVSVGRSAIKAHGSSHSRGRLQVTLASSVATSPSPTRMDSDGVFLTPRSSESSTISPGTTRSFGTGSSSSHTTHATSLSLSTGHQSGLSTISETDREVMETNKEAKRRRGLERLPSLQKNGNDGTSVHSTSTSSTNPHGYLALGESPTPLREGANVPIDRFFTEKQSPIEQHDNVIVSDYVRSSSFSGSGSAMNTNSSSSSQEEPPKFVSYLDRNVQSDLTTYRESSEVERADITDEREPSPAPSDEVGSTDECDDMKLSRELNVDRLEKFRSRPPRRPGKGMAPSKSPTHRSIGYPQQHLSPPRNIVDHPNSNISRPYVRRSGGSSFPHPILSSATFNTFSIDDASRTGSINLLIEPHGTFIETQTLLRGHTYEEKSIEILKEDSIDELASTVTPEKYAKTY